MLLVLNGLLAEVQFACPQGGDLIDQTQGCFHHPNRCIRSKVFTAIIHLAPRGKQAGESLIFDAYPWVALVILQQDIEARLMFFNQGVFQQQGIKLRGRFNDLDVCNALDQQGQSGRLMGLAEIGANPLFQVLCLADIDHLTLCVQVMVDPGLMGQSFDGMCKLVSHLQ